MAESEVASVPAEPSETVRTPPRPRVKMLPKPDDSEVNAQTAKLNDEIQAQKKRIDEIRDIINNKQNGRQGRSGEQQALKNRLVELKTQFQGELVSASRVLHRFVKRLPTYVALPQRLPSLTSTSLIECTCRTCSSNYELF